MQYQWDFAVIREGWPFLLEGLRTTILAAVFAMLIASVAGLVLAVMRSSKHSILRAPAAVYIEFFRTTPGLVQVIWIFYALPVLVGVKLSPLTAGVLGLSLNLAAYVSEVYRAGIQSVPRGLSEAGLALGQSWHQVLSRIVVPLALRKMIPPLGALWVSLFKEASILSVIGATELMYNARVLMAESYRPLEVFTTVGLIYFLLTYPQAVAVEYLFARYRTKE